MTGDDDFGVPARDPGPEDERVRALLGETGPAGPIPREVSDRIGAALADLPAPGRGAPRRHPGRWLVAAAAVVVVGGGGTLLVRHLPGAGTSATSADSAAGARAENGARRGARAPSAPGDTSLEQRRLDARDYRSGTAAGRIALPHVRSDHFARDVRRLFDRNALAAELDRDVGNTPAHGDALLPYSAAAEPACTRPPGTRQRDVVTISYDARLAQLVITGSGADRVARAYTCSGKRLLDSAPLGD